MESRSRSTGRSLQLPGEQLHDITRFPLSDSSLVNMLRMESLQSLRQGSLTLPSSSIPLSTHGSDLNVGLLQDYLLPLQADSLLHGNRSRMLALTDYIIAENLYRSRANRILTDVAQRNSTYPSFLFPRESVIGQYSLSPSLFDVQRQLHHQQSKREGNVVFQEPFVPSRLGHQDTSGRTHDLQRSAPMPFHGRESSLSLNEQPPILGGETNDKKVRDKREKDESTTPGTSSPSKKQKVTPAEEGESAILNYNLVDSDKPYRKHQSENWKERYGELVEFRKRHGHCLVPNVFKENPPLAEWVKRQRYQYKLKKLGEHNSMSDERVKMLETLGFVWNSHDLLWEERLNDLKQYKEMHGDCNVPSNYSPNPSLAIWVKRQRRQYKFMTEAKVSTMTRKRIKKLNEIGFSWAARRATQDKERPKR